MTKMFWTSQVVKSGSTETRMEKRIVITADSDADQDKVNTGPQERSLMREFRCLRLKANTGARLSVLQGKDGGSSAL